MTWCMGGCERIHGGRHGGLLAQGGGQGRLLAGQRQDCQENGGGKQPCMAEGIAVIAVVDKDVV